MAGTYNDFKAMAGKQTKAKIQKKITPQDAVDLLNEAAKLNAQAIRALVDHRVRVNDKLADHPTIQVAVNRYEVPYLGMLGVLNGLFGIDEHGCGAILAEVSHKYNGGIKFTLNPNFAGKKFK